MRKLINHRAAGLLLATMGAFATQACDDKNNPLGDVAEQCGLVCSDAGIVEGNASISGLPNVDAFFASVVNFNAKANLVSGNIDAELAKIKATLGLKATDGGAAIKAAIVTKFKLDADADIKLVYTPAQCAVSAKATLEATAKCDATVDPGKATVKCEGSCQADASVEAKCDASATVKCVGTAPNFECAGECKGKCEVTAGAACSGTCKGTCEGNCSAENAQGQCEGSCDGTCKGTCELAAAATCEGSCKGECTYTPPSGSCEAGASVKCEAKANASVECNGKCEGEVEPPKASAECQASAKADASVNVECTPPAIDLQYQFAANLDAAAKAEAQAELEAFLVSFKGSISVIVAQLRQSEFVLKAGADIGANAEGAVSSAIEAIDVSGSLKVKVGVGCALLELPKVADAIKGSTANLQASASAAGELTAAFK